MLSKLRMLFIWFSPLLIREVGVNAGAWLLRVSFRVFDRQTLAFFKKECAYAHFSALRFFEQNLKCGIRYH